MEDDAADEPNDNVEHPPEGDSLEALLDEGLRRVHGPDVRTLPSWFESRIRLREPDAPTAGPIPENIRALLDRSVRYEVRGEIARGGIGIVLRAFDRDLGRDVALKVLRPELADRQELLERFVEEAQIGGQLEHPGIVPVYEIGAQSDDRPFFAMKLVSGRTFAALLAERSSQTDDEVVVLGIFEKVCQTVAYAHARGVVHRDLKTENVMVGAFGEVQVVDWGLAKILAPEPTTEGERARQQPHDIRALETVRTDEDTDRSTAGSVFGTPAFMPPEQARGLVDCIDERSDVFALGAILLTILTGKPAYTGPDTKRQARDAELDDARRRLAAIEGRAELCDLVRACLEPEQGDRPRNASAVADQVRAYLTDTESRAQRAEVEAARSDVQLLEERKARRRLKTFSTAIAAVALVAAAAAILAWQFKSEADDKTAEAERNLDNYDRVASIVKLRDVLAARRDFEPAWPEKTVAMASWLVRADELETELGSVQQTLVRLRERALPRTNAEIEADRLVDSDYGELVLLRDRVLPVLRRVLAVHAGEADPPTEPKPSIGPVGPHELLSRARKLVDPHRPLTTFGQEALGLALARLAYERATEQRHQFSAILSFALLANGRFDEALAMSKESRRLAPPALHGHYDKHLALTTRLIDAAPQEVARTEAHVEKLRHKIESPSGRAARDRRRTFRFDRESDRFLHAALVKVESDLEHFLGENGARQDVRHLHDWSRRLFEATRNHPQAGATWAEADAAIRKADGTVASTLYRARPFDLIPQTGLVPIGKNPKTGLWEFYHLRSACKPGQDPAQVQIPKHDSSGRIEVGEETGIVFVLIPGGSDVLGTQSDDPTKPNYDPARGRTESLHGCHLPPFFLARHELSQGQFQRLSGAENPSRYKPGFQSVDLRHPVERLTWAAGVALLRRHGLSLPWEQEWEYACRAGRDTAWFPGVSDSALKGHANVLDQAAQRAAGWKGVAVPFADGFVIHAPVGSFRGNAFGLHDMHGNVAEWCHDPYGDGDRFRIHRGGAYNYPAGHARCGARQWHNPELLGEHLGCRPRRELSLKD